MRRLPTMFLWAVVCFLVMAGMPGTIWLSSAQADTTYVPSPDNNQRVYLSEACHNSSSTGPCNTNFGCDNYSENVRSADIAYDSLRSPSGGLLDRQYIVRIGNGTIQENIQHSNSWNSRMHIPIHTNAAGAATCNQPASEGIRGTHGLYRSNNDQELARELKQALGASSPGTGDAVIHRGNLGELSDTQAVAGYLEAEFHDWPRGVNWLRESNSWTWLIGLGVDTCRGYPRGNGGPTFQKDCTW